ncbi:MAG: chromatin associated KTI12 [Lasallia pustulata]|uniref:Chromatin associated KTI12 n=1 Tax=Lasallia pustulata TaxID=136370 RepID=A0A5M8PEK0_9LECA|nr:MAG: chromatin associated KTI12 [Lasallia pustulata]
MPLILLSGYPSSGKTHRARQLVDFFNSEISTSSDPRITRLSVSHINDESLGLSRDVYREARTEKDARATAYSAIKRVLGKDHIVVADGLNYIKGFRYQLYCEAKAMQTPSCVVHVGTPIETCRDNNRKLLADTASGGGYADAIFENLVYRYEEPNGMTRWDSPLFTVPWDDETPPFAAIWEAMIGSDGKGKVVKPNQATVLKPATEADYLYELDKSTQEILNKVLEWQKDHPGEGGGEINLDDAGSLELPAAPLTLPQLQRVRRQFISLNRQHNLAKPRIRSSFIEYLNDNLH